jgi:hypothetical protein
LGPAGGEQEIVTEQSVRNRYSARHARTAEAHREEEEEPLEELADGSADSVEEGTAEPSTPANRSVAPSTFGLSFCLDLAETAFEAEALWGQYLRDQDAEGKSIWKRYPRGGSKTIPLKEGNLAPWSPESESPAGGCARAGFGAGLTIGASRSSSPTSRQKDRPRDMYWLFQAQLEVRGRFARRPGQGHVSTLDAVSRLEDQTNEMLYRARWSSHVAMASVSSGNWPRAS